MSVSLCLMTIKGLSVLQSLTKNGYRDAIEKVIIGRDEQLQDDFSEEIIKHCNKNSIPWTEREENFKTHSDYVIAVSWRWIINTKSNLIVLHDSLLPSYRGFAPLVNAIINQEPVTGVTAIFGNDEYDNGDIILQSELRLQYPIKINDAITLICKNYEELVLQLMQKITAGEKIQGVPQDQSKASYSLWRDKTDYMINWEDPSDKILQFIYAVGFPYKSASTYVNGVDLIRITDARVVKDVKIENRACGKVIFIENDKPIIVCGKGLLMITEAHFEKSKNSALPFVRFRSRLGRKGD